MDSKTRQILFSVAAVLSLLAALLHVWVMPEHFEEWWGYGAFFLVAATAQALYAVVLLRAPTPTILWAGDHRQPGHHRPVGHHANHRHSRLRSACRRDRRNRSNRHRLKTRRSASSDPARGAAAKRVATPSADNQPRALSACSGRNGEAASGRNRLSTPDHALHRCGHVARRGAVRDRPSSSPDPARCPTRS
jgi:hypothetical protein